MALKFDPTINAGHILTFLTMTVAIGSTAAVLDRRISVLEERSNSAVVAAVERQSEQKDSLREIKSDIKDLQKSVNEISRAVAGRPTLGGGSGK